MITPIISPAQVGSFSEATGNLDLNTITGEFLADSSVVGTYQVVYNSTFNPACSPSDTFTLNILSTDTADIMYPSIAYCYGDGTPTPMNMGTTGGTYATASLTLNVDPVTGGLDIDNAAVGAHAVIYTTPLSNPCIDIDTFIVTISEADTVDISYAQATYCLSDANPTAMIMGDNNGLFSVNNAGLMVEPISGELMLSSASAGTYDITYTTQGQCPTSSTFNVTVSADDVASIAYDSSTFCVGSPAPAATITGTTGGTFSSTGLTVDPATGVIDLSNAAPNTGYQITYTTAGACPTTANVVVNVIDCTPVISATTDIQLENAVKLFPNPNQGQFNLEWMGENTDATLNIYNAVGQQVLSRNMWMEQQAVYTLNVEDLAAGTYLVQIQTATEITSIRMLITRP